MMLYHPLRRRTNTPPRRFRPVNIAASVMTTSALHQQINGPSDLADKSVGTIKGTFRKKYFCFGLYRDLFTE